MDVLATTLNSVRMKYILGPSPERVDMNIKMREPDVGFNLEENIQRKGRIRMATATELVRLKPDDKKDYTFVIKATGRDWILDPGSQTAWEEWQAKLRPMLG